MTYDDHCFDVTVCYNALGHLEENLPEILSEMVRVTRDDGYLLFCSTWKLDRIVMDAVMSLVSTVECTVQLCKQEKHYHALLLRKCSKG